MAEAARLALHNMTTLLVSGHGMEPVEAAMLIRELEPIWGYVKL